MVAQVHANDLIALRHGRATEFEEQIPRGNEMRTFLSSRVPLLNPEGKTYALCSVSTDITERQRAARNLRKAHDQLEGKIRERTAELEASNQLLREESAHHRQTAETLEKTQGQLVRAQKMELIGNVAGGVAHDFNNILTAIMGYTSLLLRDLDETERERGPAGMIMRAAERAATLSRQLLAFGHLRPNEPRVLAPAEVVATSETMLAPVVGDTIELRTAVEPDCGTLLADPNQIEQMLLNLVVNARDAMPRGGVITIAARPQATTKVPPSNAPSADRLDRALRLR